ncbi:hypothetical protein MGYG_05342 [Nannizzia gypsea CBS 118893]|uniref:Uncharacterized protein n=1 Tax=Arthroderma gypseum (strain ATCC MYA-4604 / CBS 118893) TaxID=535722 RepID=E4UVL8_ARTGP|nr:hypothetical protein MGYG_05342 [Nannizzia gypsea CBS 118893]EFR02345.1 hypothetical protein MGYG_05342 [Nannizzia gypsea CBS 118893]
MDIRNILRAQRLAAPVAAEARSSNSLPRKSALRVTNSEATPKRVSFHEAVTVVNVEKWVVPGVHSEIDLAEQVAQIGGPPGPRLEQGWMVAGVCQFNDTGSGFEGWVPVVAQHRLLRGMHHHPRSLVTVFSLLFLSSGSVSPAPQQPPSPTHLQQSVPKVSG